MGQDFRSKTDPKQVEPELGLSRPGPWAPICLCMRCLGRKMSDHGRNPSPDRTQTSPNWISLWVGLSWVMGHEGFQVKPRQSWVPTCYLENTSLYSVHSHVDACGGTRETIHGPIWVGGPQWAQWEFGRDSIVTHYIPYNEGVILSGMDLQTWRPSCPLYSILCVLRKQD